jgi:hypothetical protein
MIAARCDAHPPLHVDSAILVLGGIATDRKEDLAMCYEESFFQRWARKRAQRRQELETAVERDRPKQPSQPAPEPAMASRPRKSRHTERDVEVV